MYKGRRVWEEGYYIELYPLVEGEEGRGGRLLHRTVSTCRRGGGEGREAIT